MLTNLEGTRLDAYRLTRRLGGGTFGDVYLAEDLHRSTQNTQNTQVAIKVMEPLKTQEAIQDFLSEVSTLIRLHHPNIIPVRGLGIDKKTGVPFIVMEYASNGTLRQCHPRGTQVPLEPVVSYVRQIANALQCAHDDNLIHRDVKPDNVLIGANNELLLSDFGITTFSPTLNMNLSQPAPQNTAGTAIYIAPEQCQGKPEKASDQYSLAIMTYEWLCGTCPFKGSNHFEVYYQHINVAPQPLRELVPSIPPRVEAVVMKALAKAPKDRYVSVRDFAVALEDAYQQHLKSQKTKEQWIREGNAHYDAQCYKDAISDYTRAIELDPNDADTPNYRGRCYKKLKQFDQAIADFTRAIELGPKPNAYHERGNIYYALKQFDRAIIDFTSAIEFKPSEPSEPSWWVRLISSKRSLDLIYNKRGLAYKELKQFDRAVSDFSRAIEIDRRTVTYYYNRGGVYEETKQHWQALQDYVLAFEINPNYTEAFDGKERVKKILKL